MATAPAIPTIDNATKTRFARELLRTKNANTAALSIIANPGVALLAAKELPFDLFVIEEMERLTEENGEAAFLPNRYEIARMILERAKDIRDAEGFEKLMKLYCNVMGYIEKPGANVAVDVKVNNVLVMTDHGSDDQWANKAAAQQKNLVLNAAN
jgi:hypothetical protein